MTEGSPRLAVVLGASGLLGAATVRALSERGWTVLAVGRDRTRVLEATRGVAEDVAEHDVVAGDPAGLTTLVAQRGGARVLIVDAVIDKKSARAMWASIDGATRTVVELCQGLISLGAEVSVIGCGTTASQAGYPYRTTYGRAKHRQAATYLKLGVPAAVVHLPMLLGTPTRPPARLDRLLWPLFDFPVFACAVANAATAIAALADAAGSPELVLQVERANLIELRDIEPGQSPGWVAMAAAPIVAALGHTILHNDPAWQRRASYALLRLTPPAVRRKADHHMVRPFVQTSGWAQAATTHARSFPSQHPE